MHVYVNPLMETELFLYFNLIFLTFLALFHFLIENVQCIMIYINIVQATFIYCLHFYFSPQALKRNIQLPKSGIMCFSCLYCVRCFSQRIQGEFNWSNQHFCFQICETFCSPSETALKAVSEEVVQITAIKCPHLGILSSDYLC